MILDAQPDIDVVGDAENGRLGVELCQRTRPDVVLMDIRMPVLDGIEATRLITSSEGCATRVLVLTTFDLDEYVYAAMRAGASGYLLKDTPAKELVAAVRVIAQGDALLSPSVTQRLIEEFARQPEPGAVTDSASGRPHRPRARGARAAGPRAQQPRDRGRRCTSARRQPRPTSADCSPSSACATVCRPSCSPTKPASSAPDPLGERTQLDDPPSMRC